MRQLPKHHDRLTEIRAKIAAYREEYKSSIYYDLRGEPNGDIEVLQLEDIPTDVIDALSNMHNHQQIIAHFLDIATIITNHPRIPISHINSVLGVTHNFYRNICAAPAVSAYLIQLRRSCIDADVIAAGMVLRRLLFDPDPRVSFQAAKFILENNGQDYGYGAAKNEQNHAVKIVFEDKTTNSIRYSDEDLEDV